MTERAADESAPALHPVYLRVLAAVVARRGVRTTDGSVDDSDAMRSLRDVRERLLSARSATATPWLGLELGDAIQSHAHGMVGTAAMASRTLGDALATLARFASLRVPALQVRYEPGPEYSTLTVVEQLPLGDARGLVFDALLVIVERVAQSLSGQSLAEARYDLPGPAPDWAERYRDRLEGTVRFVRGNALRLHLPTALLASPCLTADAASHAHAAAECARLIEQRQSRRSCAERVRSLLAASGERMPDAATIASHLHLSVRSLHRRLADEQTSLRQLTDALRRDRACCWLRETDWPVERIAERLGYADTSNFARCFKRWTGQTPRDYRNSGVRDSASAR